MLEIKKATKKNFSEINKILNDLELTHKNQIMDNFILALKNDQIIGIGELTSYPNFFFLSSFGIIKEYQKKGYGKKFLRKILAALNNPIYLYTIESNFFIANGFTLTIAPESLPPKNLFYCQNCQPDKCSVLKYPVKP
ncbi:MAG: GNAT family N-acetyltransferase [Candidatus Margulisiibacteriota bacterium]|jgi:N-acetylglutamate synthase-like GNAT family acetyltransferase